MSAGIRIAAVTTVGLVTVTFVIGYGGVAQAHGSKIEGHHVDPNLGMPTWKEIFVEQ